MKVSDIMTQDVVTVGENVSLKEAAGIFASRRVQGLPVVDENKKLIGIVTESDFINKEASDVYGPAFRQLISGEQSEMAEEVSGGKVSDIMTVGCQTVSPEMNLEDLLTLFKEKDYNSLPVVDESGTLLGIVSHMDIIKLL